MTIRIAFPGLLVLLAACHSEGPTSSGMDTVDASSMHTDGAGSDVASSSPNPSSSVKPVGQAVLRGDGSLAIFRPKKNPFAFATVDTDAGAPIEGQWLQVSAPILPKVLRLYQGQGNNYPTTFAAQSTLALESALTFEELEQACLNFSPEYTSAIVNGEPQIAAKYWVLEQCAYKRFTAKPYWIPQLLLDVDVCEQSLGQGYRTLRESDVRAFLPGEVEAFKKRLDEVNRGGGSFYFSMSVWVRAADGTMASVDLASGATAPIKPLVFPQQGWTAKNHYEGNLALRCLRIVDSLD